MVFNESPVYVGKGMNGAGPMRKNPAVTKIVPNKVAILGYKRKALIILYIIIHKMYYLPA